MRISQQSAVKAPMTAFGPEPATNLGLAGLDLVEWRVKLSFIGDNPTTIADFN